MRLSDLLEHRVVDQHGRDWGQVHDAHLIQDGPLLASQSAALRLHGLIAGRAAFGTRLGYLTPPRTRGPWLVKAVVLRLHRDAVYVPWHAVRAVEAGCVRVESPPEGFATARDGRVRDSAADTTTESKEG